MLVYCSYQGRGVGGSIQRSLVRGANPLGLGAIWELKISNNDGDGYENVTYKVNSRCLKRYRAYSISFNLSYVRLNSEGLYQSSGKEKESCCLVFPSSTKREIRHFHVVVVQRRLRNVQKSVMHVQRWVFANISRSIALRFGRSHCRRRYRCLSSLLLIENLPRS